MKYIKSKIKDFLSKKIYYHQHPETAIRYDPIVKLIQKNGWVNHKILEVGSGSIGIAAYINSEIIGVDNDFSEPEHPNLIQVKGSGNKLPFKNKTFTVSILSDVLEHVPKKNRKKLILETIRVTKEAVIISGPFGKESFKQDLALSKLSNHHFFKEHIIFGLPDVAEIENLKSSRIYSISKIGSFFNLRVRYLLMKLFVSNNKFLYYLYLKGLMPFVPILLRLNKPPQYRTVYLLGLKK